MNIYFEEKLVNSFKEKTTEILENKIENSEFKIGKVSLWVLNLLTTNEEEKTEQNIYSKVIDDFCTIYKSSTDYFDLKSLPVKVKQKLNSLAFEDFHLFCRQLGRHLKTRFQKYNIKLSECITAIEWSIFVERPSFYRHVLSFCEKMVYEKDRKLLEISKKFCQLSLQDQLSILQFSPKFILLLIEEEKTKNSKDFVPFSSCIDILNSMHEKNSPRVKLGCINHWNQTAVKSLEFYNVDTGADQLTPVLAFSLLRADNLGMGANFAQLLFIENFLDRRLYKNVIDEFSNEHSYVWANFNGILEFCYNLDKKIKFDNYQIKKEFD